MKMATHSSILALRIPWTEESGRLQSKGLQSWTRLSISTKELDMTEHKYLLFIHFQTRTETPPLSLQHLILSCQPVSIRPDLWVR